MLKSMTAYGRSTHTSPYGYFVLEIQSVNRKYLDILIQIPREFSFLDSEIRQWVSSKVSRGQIVVKLSVTYQDKVPMNVVPNIPLARQIQNAWEQLANDLGYPQSQIDLQLIGKQEDILKLQLSIEQEEEYKNAILESFKKALVPFNAMKDTEGKHLSEDISTRLDKFSAWMDEIESQSTQTVSKFKEKLIQRLNEVIPNIADNEEKVLREIIVYAEKVDITEEITRFKSHIKKFQQILKGAETAIGKTLEFLLQEMGREVNTIGSKSNDITILHRIVDLKTELEKIREQIQNVE
jgi:uncharacterized protein (TIGR00255 family)